MPELPSEPISPAAFMEDFVPSVFAELAEHAVGEELMDVEVAFGARLEGEDGGEWELRLSGGALAVTPGRAADVLLTVISTVDDWRGALWEGRGGVFGRQVKALLRGDGLPTLPGLDAGPPDFEVLAPLRDLDGLMRVAVEGGEHGDWSVGILLGPGPVPSEPTTTVAISDEDARAIARGELDPLQAFMAGRIEVGGDVALMLQVQAILLQATLPPLD